MTGDFPEAALAAGWTFFDGRARGPHGVEAWVDEGGDGRPDHEHLCFAGELAGQRFAFAVSFPDEYGRNKVASEAMFLPDALAAGAVVPWLSRMREDAAVWGRAGDGPWWPLGGGARKYKVAAPTGEVKEQVTAWLATLTVDPAAEVTRRAERLLETLRDAGWRTVDPSTGKKKSGLRGLAAATLSGVGGAKHRIEYVLVGDASLPEAVLWQYRLPGSGDRWTESVTWLIDVTGVLDLDVEVPLPATDDRLAAALGVITREAPAMAAGESWRPVIAAATVTPVVSDGKSLIRVGERDDLDDVYSVRDTPSLDEAAAAVRAEPADGARWLTFAVAALRDQRRQLAVAAVAKAVSLSPDDPIPLLCHGWLLRALDRDLAIRQFDRAAATGRMVGLARRCLGATLLLHDDPDAALAAFGRATEEDPGYVTGWLKYGLYLAKGGRVTQAAQVLAEAAATHPLDAEIAYYLGYARLLTDDQDGAIDALETSVRLDPGLATTIVEDPDLESLVGQPRFDALPQLAAGGQVALRDALRPTEPARTLPPDRANDLETVVKVLGIFSRRVDGYSQNHADGITHEATRRFLEKVGLPCEAGEFRLDGHFDSIGGAALSEYRTDEPDTRVYGADRVPAGLAGLFLLGKLGDDGAEAALDGETGELYRVAHDYTLSWLATDLESFFWPRCLPADAWVWRLGMDTIHLLDSPDRIGAGELGLVAQGLDDTGHERLRLFLREHGELVNYLRVTASLGAEADLTDLDLATSCPNLAQLYLYRGGVNDSVFRHPTLAKLELRESTCKGARHLELDTGSRLTKVSLEDCLVHADTLRVGPGSPLHSFHAAIDQDYGFEFPERLEFDNCQELATIDLKFEGGAWTLVLRGSLPKLFRVRQDARPYGKFTSEVADATPADQAAYQSLIRKGARYAGG